MPDQFQFTSDEFSPEAAFEAYVRLYSQGSDVSRGPGAFHARVRGWRLDGILLFERFLSGVIHSREARVSRDGFDHITLTLIISGSMKGSAPSGYAEAGPGDIVFMDTLRPSRAQPVNAHMLTASIDRTVIEAAIGSSSGLHGRVLPAPDNLMLADFMQSLARNGDRLDAGTLPGLTRAFIDILATVASAGVRASTQARRLEYLRREAVERYIGENLSDRTLAVATISAATGISRSALYRMFEADGGVARRVLVRRLQAVQAALDNRDQSSLADLAQRYGFSDGSHLSRLFAEAFGQSPGPYRRAVAATVAGTPDDSQRRWRGWMAEVS
eukprot:TRINITY_DN6009_c0_g3_i1.p1 TRINITY_DN6009_c0_g3~~TRINITY_DN6009_c0_g3_i1.p1  ORF type:complete len:329 (+),score=-19.99 TRINITY_DN6009_c0_g3_i1:166-1152(+)